MATEKEYQQKQRNKAVPAVYLILFNFIKNKILLSLRKNTGYQDGKWELPAGHIELGELPTEAMVREAFEEIGVIIQSSDLNFVHVSYRPTHDETGDRVDFVFFVKRWTGEPKVCEIEKSEKIDWFYPDELPENMIPHHRELVSEWYSDSIFSELGVDWLKAKGLYTLEK